VKVHVPVHLKPEFIAAEAYRRAGASASERAKIKYIKPKSISIREYIAQAEKMKKS